MTHCVTILAAAFVAAVFIPDARAEAPEEEIRRAILALGEEDAKLRDNAQLLLAEIGPEAVLLYHPDVQGKDAEIRRRMEELMDAWEFGSEIIEGDGPGGPRVRPWVAIEEALGLWASLEDDRLPSALELQLDKPRSDQMGYFENPDVPLSASLLRAAIDKKPKSVSRIAVREDLNLADDCRAILLEFLRGENGRQLKWTPYFLYRLGEREPLLATVRGGKLDDLRYGSGLKKDAHDLLAGDAGFCAAIAEGFAKSPDHAGVANRFPSDGFADFYLGEEDAGRLAQLERAVSLPRLRELLNVDRPSVRFNAAVALAAFGEATEDLKQWTDREIWRYCECEADTIARAATLLTGERVEERLRELADDASLDPEVRFAALRGLAARKRVRDITFVYTHLKELPAQVQPEVAIDLARLGSAAGANVLIPKLYGTGYAFRRDANNALKKITGQDFNYNPAGTLPERCRAARKWAIWWRENRTSFHPDLK
ncbi:MAG: hypothetical protein AAB074_09265 [Planctomycetota bacterium]